MSWGSGISAWAGAMMGVCTIVAPAAATDGSTGPPDTYAPAVQKISPSVVSIFSVKSVASDSSDAGLLSPHSGQGGASVREEESLGSGVIVSSNGYILSNFHVVKDAEEISVVLPDSDEKYEAKIVGTDEITDLALIKIAAANLSPATLGDSDRVTVGDVCFAVGDPFGVGQTVTMGIISATGRTGLGISDYEDFIQTDAAINPGNSGGALADNNGDVIGINTAIVSASRGGEGVGFAVPSNLAWKIMEELRLHGRVVRSFLGVVLQPLDYGLAKQFGLPSADGALVGDVAPGSPAARAGLLPGDAVVEFNGKRLADPGHLRLLLSAVKPGDKVTLGIDRNGKEIFFPITLGEAPSPDLALRPAPRRPEHADLLKGVTVTDLDLDSRRELKIPENISGVLVIGVEVESPAFIGGLKPGDVIEEIDRHPVKTTNQALDRGKSARGEGLLLRVYDERTSHFMEIDRIGRMEEAPIEPVRE